MLKISKNPGIYEVWCEAVAESAFIDHEPSDDELKEIIKKEMWDKFYREVTPDSLRVEPLNRLYIKAKKLRKIEKTKKTKTCEFCRGEGIYMDEENHYAMACYKCGGKGKI